MEYILQMQDIQHRYNGRTILDIPELHISPGTITGLAGPNGSGKSTLLKILSCTEKCASGTIYFAGEPALPFARKVRHRITMLPQETYLLRRTVFENIAYGLKVRNGNKNLSSSVQEALELVGLHHSFAGRQWHELSGGEAQRVALAARLALKPACLLLDEPTASVDMESARFIRRAVLLAKKEWGTTLIIASHHQLWLNDICDDLIYIYNGRILDCSFENILLGPWKKCDDHLSCTELADGQIFYVSTPPRPQSCAVIAPEAISLTNGAPPGDKKLLNGTITGIFLDNLQTEPRIHVVCGDHRFVIAAPDGALTSDASRPGQKVSLLYNPDDITWLPE